MRAVRLATVIMLLASPAFAQIPKLNLLQDKPGKSEDEKAAILGGNAVRLLGIKT